MKLYELTNQYHNALTALDDPDLPPEAVQDTLEGLQGEITEKGKNVAAYFQNLEADVEAMKAAEQRIAQRRKTAESRVRQMKEYLLHNMQECGISEISCPEFTVKLGKCPASVEIVDKDELPKQYIVTKTETAPDKKALKEALQNGDDINGARLVADKQRLIVR